MCAGPFVIFGFAAIVLCGFAIYTVIGWLSERKTTREATISLAKNSKLPVADVADDINETLDDIITVAIINDLNTELSPFTSDEINEIYNANDNFDGEIDDNDYSDTDDGGFDDSDGGDFDDD